MNPRNPYETGPTHDNQPSVVEQARERRRLPAYAGGIAAAALVVGLVGHQLAENLPDFLQRDHYMAPQDPTEEILGIPSNEGH